MPRTAERGGPQTRARIVEVAGRLFYERGFDAVTVADVAREAGVSSVTVFKHFPRKEDLFLDRSDDAVELLRAAVRTPPDGVDVLAALTGVAVRLAEERHGLSGLDERSLPFFRTVAGSPALVTRARELAAELQAVLTEELRAAPTSGGEPALLAAFLVAGYATVLQETVRRRLAGESVDAIAPDHRARLDRLVTALRDGLTG